MKFFLGNIYLAKNGLFCGICGVSVEFFISTDIFRRELLHHTGQDAAAALIVDEGDSVYARFEVHFCHFRREWFVAVRLCKDKFVFLVDVLHVHGWTVGAGVGLSVLAYRITTSKQSTFSYYPPVNVLHNSFFDFEIIARVHWLIYSKFLRKIITMLGKTSKRLTLEDIRQRLTHFLLNFQDPEMEMEEEPYSRLGKLKYRIAMQRLANERAHMMEVHLEDLEEMLRREQDRAILQQVTSNTKRFVEMLYEIVEKNMPQRNVEINPEDQLRYELENALEKQRRENLIGFDASNFADNELIPARMHRKFHIVIVHRAPKAGTVRSISQLNSSLIGSLVVLKGIVIRTDQVKPRLSVATFTCDVCGSENYMEVFNDHFRPLTECQSRKCKENGIAGKLSFIPKHSHFIPTQEIKIQETPDQLREGNIPRNLKLVLAETNVKKALPGDVVQIQGVLLPKRKEGYAHEQDLVFDACIEAFKIESQKKKYVDMQITEEDEAEIHKLRQENSDDELFDRLSKSIAPEIYGMEYVKKALLLLLAGGVTTITPDRLRIRGEINLMLVGDPGVAKSQLLKHISHLAPRGVYTTGKGSSDVGLTAAIKIDPVTKDVSLQAGALVLADMGVCCIDEFDKMNEYDRTAIHEVMEQQTVSIAKAGITTTLNARTSVLAAANPLYSRYNPAETPQKNINLPAALLSRFDLIFILLDIRDYQMDLQLAKHIGEVHKNKNSSSSRSDISGRTLRNYIGLAKSYEPRISEELTSMMIDRYVQRRQYYADRTKQGERYITTRNLLALIRMCQARARLRFSNAISKEDILECEEIMLESQKHVSKEERRELTDDISSIYGIIRDLCNYRMDKTVEMEAIEKRILARGHSLDDLNNTLHHYEEMNVLMRNKNGTVQIVE